MVLIAWDGGPLYGNLKRPIFYTFASVGIAVGAAAAFEPHAFVPTIHHLL